jgi:hypothetical protein
MSSALAQEIEAPPKSSGKRRGVRRCLNSGCKHVFIVEAGDSMARCPECKNAPCGLVRKGDTYSWTLKEAKQIASILRG